MRLITVSLFLLFAMTGCNVFSPLDSSGSALDKCKGLSDAGAYEEAVKACQDAVTDNPNDMEAQLELADVSLASLGINIKALSDIFLKSSSGTVTIVSLAEAIIAAEKITTANSVTSKLHATEAIKAFDSYGTLLKADGTTASTQVATFYSTISRLCYLSLLMAYSDLGPNGNHDGLVDKTDICSTSNCGVAGTICINSLLGGCGGMDNGDALEVSKTIFEIKDKLASLGLGDLQKVLNEMSATMIPDPTTGFVPPEIPISTFFDSSKTQYDPFKADAGREILRVMAR
ncbi:MAG: hypothetical protein WCQ47_08920 [bacterium]